MGLIRALFRRWRMEQTLDDEVQQHIEWQTEEYVQAGMPPKEARRAAMLRFGTVTSVKERCREQNGLAGLESIWQDLRFAIRTFVSQPGLTAVLLMTLALGVGANTAVFSVLRTVLFEPLPLPEPDRVVLLWEHDRIRGTEKENASYPDYIDLRQGLRLFEHLAAAQPMDATLTGRGETERVPAERVSASFFDVLGLAPVIGRAFSPGEGGVVLSHSLWQRKFGGNPGILGSTIYLDGFAGVVVGVMPPEANSLTQPQPELWTSLETVTATQFRGQHGTRVLGRLRRGVAIEQAQAEVTAIMARLEKDYPDDNLGRGATVVPLHEELAGDMRPALAALSAAVAVLLLIACVNIANLLLARASARGREMAVRVSLGASRWRLTRQLLTESLMLAWAGAALGLAVAWWGVRGLIALAPPDTPLISRTSVDGTVLLATFLVSLAAWLIFGLLPALRASIVQPRDVLQSSARSTASLGSLRLRSTLVISQIAMATVLVIVSGLLVRSFWRLRQINLGYEPRGAISLRIKLPETRYPWPPFPFRDWPAAFALHDRLKAAVKELPGVEAVSLAMTGPSRASWTTRVTVDGRPAPPEGEQQEAQFRTADPDYLLASGARLMRGRFFTESDGARQKLVAAVNERFVQRHLPGEDPLGRHIVVFGDPREIVGVIGDMRYAGPSSAPEPAMYFPLRQAPFPDLTVIVRSLGDPGALTAGLREAVLAADPNIAPFDVVTLQRSLLDATARERFILSLLTGFAAIALLLAAVGIYGVVAYTVGRKQKEIALRMALGARAGDVFWQVVGETLVRTAAGVSGGIVLALLAGRLIQPLVFETSTRDLTTYAVVASVLVVVGFLGAAAPTTRAVRVSSAEILRED